MGISAVLTPAAPPAAIDVTADASPADWNGYVERRRDASIYHLAQWAPLIRRAFGHQPRYLAARQGNQVVGILPLVRFATPLFGRFVTSMPFVNYGGIIADTKEAEDALLAGAIAEAQAVGASYVELRHTHRMFEHLPVQTHKVAMVLSLQPTVETQWDALDRKLRNQVRKAEKSGLTTRVGGAELLPAFYDVLARNMRDLGSPVHSKNFFKAILETFPDHSRLFCVSLGSTPVAASFVLWHGDRLEVPWASALRSYNPLCPNVLLYWEMVKFGIERRFARFDFGRSTPLEGTYQFKKQWGAEPQQLYWEYWLAPGSRLPDRSPKNPKFGSAIALWRRLPVMLTRAIGPSIVRNIP